MSWLKWPLVFCVVYGVLWARQQIRGATNARKANAVVQAQHDVIETGDSEDLLRQSKTESPQSKKTLSYAFQKLTRPEREISSLETAEDLNTNALNLEAVLNLKDQPPDLLIECEKQLSLLGPENTPERVILLREVISARNSETKYQVEELLEAERAWLSGVSTQIHNMDAFRGYIGELTRLSLMADTGRSSPLSTIQELSAALSHNALAHQALQQAVKDYIPWEYNNWVKGLPERIQFDEEK